METETQIETKTVMSLEQLQQTPEFNACTPKQRKWILSLIQSNGDAMFATKAAYQSGSDLYAQMLTHQVQANPRVRAALNLFFGRTDRDEILDGLQKKLLKKMRRGSELTVAEKDGIKILFAARGWELPPDVDLRTNGYTPRPRELFCGRHCCAARSEFSGDHSRCERQGFGR